MPLDLGASTTCLQSHSILHPTTPTTPPTAAMCVDLWIHRTDCDTRAPALLSDALALLNPFSPPDPCVHCPAAHALEGIEFIPPQPFDPRSALDIADLEMTSCPIHGGCCGLTRTYVCFSAVKKSAGEEHCGHFREFHRFMTFYLASKDEEFDDLRRIRAGALAGHLRIFPEMGTEFLADTTNSRDPRPRIFELAVRAHKILFGMEDLYWQHVLRGQIRHDLKNLSAKLMLEQADLLLFWATLSSQDVLEPVIPLSKDAKTNSTRDSIGGDKVFRFGVSAQPIETIEHLYQCVPSRSAYAETEFKPLAASYEHFPAEDPETFLPVTERVHVLFTEEERALMKGNVTAAAEHVETMLRYISDRARDPSPGMFFNEWKPVDWNQGWSIPEEEELGPLDDVLVGEEREVSEESQPSPGEWCFTRLDDDEDDEPLITPRPALDQSVWIKCLCWLRRLVGVVV